MKTVWILVVLANNGHFINQVIPTLEFRTEQLCKKAIAQFTANAQTTGTVRMRCEEIEK